MGKLRKISLKKQDWQKTCEEETIKIDGKFKGLQG